MKPSEKIKPFELWAPATAAVCGGVKFSLSYHLTDALMLSIRFEDCTSRVSFPAYAGSTQFGVRARCADRSSKLEVTFDSLNFVIKISVVSVPILVYFYGVLCNNGLYCFF